MAIEKDQIPEGKSSEIKGLADVWESEFFEKGLEALEEEPPKKETKKPVVDEGECPECPPEELARRAKEKEGRKPYKILKIQGKEVPVYSEEELVELAQKGTDYTKKTQAVSEERKLLESEKAEISEVKRQYQEIMAAINKGKGDEGQARIQPEKPEIQPKDIYKEYGLDEEYADEWQKKVITDVAGIKKEKDELKAQNQRLSEAYQYMMLDGMLKAVKEAVNTARVEYPIEEIITEDGKNLTQTQFMSLLSSKINSPENKQKPIPDLAVETLREVHAMQQRSQPKANRATLDEDNLKPEDFKANFPKLYAKLAGTIGDDAIAEYLQKREALPPSLESKPRDIELKKSELKKDISLEESLDAGFADPEVLEALKGV